MESKRTELLNRMKLKWIEKEKIKKYRWQSIQVPVPNVREKPSLYYDTTISIPPVCHCCSHEPIPTRSERTRHCNTIGF